jgi:ArsR family transcriptional regulator
MNRASETLISRFKALADPARLRLAALCGVAECSVSELTDVTGLSQPRVSQHLKALIDAGLLERFRDGQFVYYRVPTNDTDVAVRRRLLALLPDDEPEFARDLAKLRKLRGGDAVESAMGEEDRLLHKALVELTVATSLGDLLDVGCGQGRLLKLLASRARRLVGVDIDPAARRLARAELLVAGLPNCSLRQGDMYALPFADAEFDTIILDDVLAEAARPEDAIGEARRLLKPGGRILFLAATNTRDEARLRRDFAAWAADASLRLRSPRSIPENKPGWLLGVATT